MKKNRIIIGAVIILVLGAVFWWGGNAPGMRGFTPQNETKEEPVFVDCLLPTQEPKNAPVEVEITQSPEPIEEITTETPKESMAPESKYKKEQQMETKDETGKDEYKTDPIPEGKPNPVEPQNEVISKKELTCTLSVRCDTILKNIEWLDAEKRELVPSDGVVFGEQSVVFYEGESVFNVMLREMKKNKIHMEFVKTPIYNSSYIEGINNLYEFDCGELSGWMYKVNGWFPNYGASRYKLKDGDRIEWVYSCDSGADVGGKYAAGEQRK